MRETRRDPGSVDEACADELSLEVERLRGMLLQAAKLAELGTRVAALVHEMNQPLVAIKAFAQMIGAQCEDEATSRRAVFIEQQAGVLVSLVDRIRTHTRMDTKDGTAHLGDVASRVVELLDHLLRRAGVDLVIEIEPESLILPLDEVQLQQVLVNLLTNAFDAVEEQEDRRVRLAGSETANKEILLTVSDTGVGIPEDLRERVLDPFFTTKDPERGTGLGLPICKEIANAHGGDLTIRRCEEPSLGGKDKGYRTVVEVRLPSVVEPPAEGLEKGGTL